MSANLGQQFQDLLRIQQSPLHERTVLNTVPWIAAEVLKTRRFGASLTIGPVDNFRVLAGVQVHPTFLLTIFLMKLGRDQVKALSPDIERSIGTREPGNQRARIFPQRIVGQSKCDISHSKEYLKRFEALASAQAVQVAGPVSQDEAIG